MIVLYAVGASFLVVLGQVFWKKTIEAAGVDNLLKLDSIGLVASQYQFWIGSFFYGLAVVAYLLLISKFPFSQAQVLFITTSIILSIFISVAVFGENVSTVQLAGAAIIIAGIVLFLRGATG